MKRNLEGNKVQYFLGRPYLTRGIKRSTELSELATKKDFWNRGVGSDEAVEKIKINVLS